MKRWTHVRAELSEMVEAPAALGLALLAGAAAAATLVVTVWRARDAPLP